MPWQSRPIFISSTFADMQAERDHLRTYVFPELEERLKTRRRHLALVDLRLGVATASLRDGHQRELQVLRVCLAEVKRCRPFLIVLLGDRYGWVPPIESIAAAAREEGFEPDVAGRSVTDLEIRFGVLADPEQQQRSFFYFREPLPYGDMTPDVAPLYSDAHDSDPQAADRARRLLALKQEIEERLRGRVRRYAVGWDAARESVTGLESWGRSVVEDIWSELIAEVPADEAEVSWHQAERNALDDLVEDRARDFVGRGAILSRLESLASSQQAAPWGGCVTGEPGSGKSALFGELYRRLRQGNTLVLAHAAAASPRAPSVEDMLRRWVGELSEALGVATQLPDTADFQTIEAAFQNLLARVAGERRVVLLIDALDQFEPTRGRYPTWLPREWPAGARLIATAIPGEASKALGERSGIETMELPPLDRGEALRIAEGICARYHRQLETDVFDLLLAKRHGRGAAWSNPLWLVLAVEELNLVNAEDFAYARTLTGPPEEQLHALMLHIVRELPADIPGVYELTFERAEGLFGARAVRAFLGLIEVSRSGWRENDFRALLPQASGEPWDELRFASLRRFFRGQMRQRGALGLWDFNHAQMRVAVRKRLDRLEVAAKELHATAARHLLTLPADDPHRQKETMVHLLGSEDWDQAAAFYGHADLTVEELDGATRILADGFGGIQAHRDGFDNTRHLLEARVDAEVGTAIVLRLVAGLDDALVVRTTLANRSRLFMDLGGQINALIAKVTPGWSAFTLARASGIACKKLGDIALGQGDMREALDQYERARSSYQRMAKADPDSVRWPLEIASLGIEIGDILFDQGNASAALQSYEESHAIAERYAAENPDHASFQNTVARCHDRIGKVQLAAGDPAGSLHHFRSALAIHEQLVKADPDDLDRQRGLLVAHAEIADALSALGDLAEALSESTTALAIVARLAEADPSNPHRQRDLAGMRSRIGEVQQAQGELSAAFMNFEAALAVMERLVAADRTNAGWQRDLALVLNRLGYVLNAQGKVKAALERFVDARGVCERLVEQDQSNVVWLNDLASNAAVIGELALALGNGPSAHRGLSTALTIRDRLAKADPGNGERQMDLATSTAWMGKFALATGNKAEAIHQLQMARMMLASVVTPSSPQRWKTFLENIEQALASLGG